MTSWLKKKSHRFSSSDIRLIELHKLKFGFHPNNAQLGAFKRKCEDDDNRSREYWRQFAIEDALRISNKAKGGK